MLLSAWSEHDRRHPPEVVPWRQASLHRLQRRPSKLKKTQKSRSFPETRWCFAVPGMSVLCRPLLLPTFQEDWEKHGRAIFELIREKYPDLYFASIVKLAQIVRIEADVKTHAAKPKTIKEVLQQVEHEDGIEGRPCNLPFSLTLR